MRYLRGTEPLPTTADQPAETDDGPGITAALHSHLFEPFWQLDHTSGGSGLGLAIVKGVVDLHGGQIRLVSEPGAGTTVRVSFPRSGEVQEVLPAAAGATA